LAISLETVSSLEQYEHLFKVIELIVVTVFLLEYVFRIYIDEDRVKYIFSLFGFIDLISILPSLLGFTNLTFLKAVRIVRVLNFLRMTRLAKLTRLNKYSNRNSTKAREIQTISIRIYGLALISAVAFFGTLLYLIEGNNSLFSNIPASVAWVTLAILGGGISAVNLSPLAKVIVIVLQFCSLLLFGLLINIAGRFIEQKLLGSRSLEE